MNKIFTSIIALFVVFHTSAQPLKEFKKVGKVTYKSYSNGKEDTDAENILVYYKNNTAQVNMDAGDIKYIPEMPKKNAYIDYTNAKIYQTAVFMDTTQISMVTDFSALTTFEITQEKEKILGFNCQKAQATVFSNKIEIWFTSDAGISGSPSIYYLYKNNLILKIVRNGNSMILADKIEYFKEKNAFDILPKQWGELVVKDTYSRRLKECFIKTVSIFDHEQLSWGNPINNSSDENASNITFKYAGGTVILKKIRLPEVTDNTNIFAEVTQYSNGDAYDRVGCIFVIPTDKKLSFLDAMRKGISEVPAFTARNGKTYSGFTATSDYTPIVELVRFYTPFGVNYFNEKVKSPGLKWADSIVYKQDITDLLPTLRGDVWVGAFIGNYDKGGHILSLNLKYHLNDIEVNTDPTKKYWVSPLFSTTNVLEMAGQEYGTLFDTDSLTVHFMVPEHVKDITFRYISTGHGGWDNGDEFVPKKNEVFLDNQLILGYTPWRTDCATYRLSNPASGDAFNGLTSSDYSRSGWCPGTTTNPVYVKIGNLTPGLHTIKVHIPQGPKEGESQSSWCVSGVMTGEIE